MLGHSSGNWIGTSFAGQTLRVPKKNSFKLTEQQNFAEDSGSFGQIGKK
jgi:hypothetical protein